jgi:hypothetical protein
MVGAVEYKLFVGSLNKQATEKEVEEVCHMSFGCLLFCHSSDSLPSSLPLNECFILF